MGPKKYQKLVHLVLLQIFQQNKSVQVPFSCNNSTHKSPPHIGGHHVTMSCCVKRQRRAICYFNRATCDVKVFNESNPVILSRSSHNLVEILCKKLTTEEVFKSSSAITRVLLVLLVQSSSANF